VVVVVVVQKSQKPLASTSKPLPGMAIWQYCHIVCQYCHSGGGVVDYRAKCLATETYPR
jgi:hypothetical protein